jgi:hypothetical protein
MKRFIHFVFEDHKWKYYHDGKRIKKKNRQIGVKYIRICKICKKSEDFIAHTND